jgi:hypothetical protein
MIVFDLKCGGGHVFEAWFGSSSDYDDQRARGLVSCPMCGNETVEKAVMAPNVAAKGNRQAEVTPAAVKAAMATLAQAQQQALANSEWVGTAFASRARAMHAGEEDHAPIHGQASIEEAKALAEDGVPVAPLPFPVVPPEACN